MWSHLQFIYINIINFPRPIPGEHEEFSTNISRAWWEEWSNFDVPPHNSRMLIEAAVFSIADLQEP